MNKSRSREAVLQVWDNLSALHDNLLDLAGAGEARRHFAASRREALLGLSSLLERAAGGDGAGRQEGDKAKKESGSGASAGSAGRTIEITE